MRPGERSPARGEWMKPGEFESHFQRLWSSVRIERASSYSLFTFGESTLPYRLLLEPEERGDLVSLTRGTVRITRPSIITPGNAAPEFQNFFENEEGEGLARFLLARSAGFSNLKFDNATGESRMVSDSVEEIISKLRHQFEQEDDLETGILVAPSELGWVALMRYAAERVLSSAPGNIQELRERGFLDF
jgi:hypothetical protein